MEDKKIICKKCGKEFIFTAGQQEFFAEKGLSEPKKCKECIKADKEARGDRGFKKTFDRAA